MAERRPAAALPYWSLTLPLYWTTLGDKEDPNIESFDGRVIVAAKGGQEL
jgi:hypothetical protein